MDTPNADEPSRQAPGVIPSKILRTVERGVWHMLGSNAENRTISATAALKYFLAHSSAVGGGNRVALDDGDEGGLSLDDILGLSCRERRLIADLHLITDPWGMDVRMPCVFATAELGILHRAPPAKRSKRGDAEPAPDESSERRAGAGLAALEAHAAFLRSLGLLACVVDDGWQNGPERSDPEGEFTRWMHLMVAAPLASVIDHGARRPFDALVQLALIPGVDPDDASSMAHLRPGQLVEMLRGAMGGDVSGSLPANLSKSPEELATLAEEWRAAGYDQETFKATGDRWMSRAPEEIEPLVEGAIYRGKVHAFLGGASTGKSTLLHELAVKLTMPLPAGAPLVTWCGLPIRRSDKPLIVRFFSGEDTEDIIADRQRMFARGGADPSNVTFLKGGADGLKRHLAGLKGKKRGQPGVPDLIVIDPALTFLRGCESDAGDVGDALGELVEIADQAGPAIIVAHHLQKNARPRSMQDIRAMVRGSQVWIDRPRIALGVLRTRGMTQVGVAKSNIRGVNDYDVLATLARDPETLLHTATRLKLDAGAAPAEAAQSNAPSVGDLGERIMAAVRRLAAEGKRVTLYGKRDGLCIHAPAELEGIARDVIAAGLRRLINAGRIARTEDGSLRPADDDAAPPLAAE